MKEYFKRLQDHPGVPVAFMLTLMFIGAGVSNKSMDIIDGILVGLICSALPWTVVLLSNRK